VINKVAKKYAKGRKIEYKAMLELMRAGYYPVRSAGSKGIFDVIGISAVDFVLIQLKSNRNASPKEVRIIKKFPVPPNCTKTIWVWKDYKGWVKKLY
jgi:hypothetical protein